MHLERYPHGLIVSTKGTASGLFRHMFELRKDVASRLASFCVALVGSYSSTLAFSEVGTSNNR